MVCPYCHQNTQVRNSRPQRAGFSVWRRRHCEKCRITFTTSEQMTLESVIALNTADGSLNPLRYADIYVSCFKALNGLKDASEIAERLTQTILEKLFKERQAIVEQALLEKYIFETLSAYHALAGQTYLINELRRSHL